VRPDLRGRAAGLPPGRHSGLLIGGGVALFALVVILILYSSRDRGAPPPRDSGEKVVVEETVADDFGWTAPAVQAAARIHDAAHAHDIDRLRGLLHGRAIYSKEKNAGTAEVPTTDAESMEEFLLLD